MVYYFTTPQGNDIPLIGIVDGNEVMVSPQITGRIVNLTVDEGSCRKEGRLDCGTRPAELNASLAAAKANVTSLEAQVSEANHNYSWTNDQTGASIVRRRPESTPQRATAPARAQLERDQEDLKRMQQLFEKGEVSAQDRDHAEARGEDFEGDR